MCSPVNAAVESENSGAALAHTARRCAWILQHMAPVLLIGEVLGERTVPNDLFNVGAKGWVNCHFEDVCLVITNANRELITIY